MKRNVVLGTVVAKDQKAEFTTITLRNGNSTTELVYSIPTMYKYGYEKAGMNGSDEVN